jgi:NADH:ubiquinone reductase (H+-translocating)
MNGPRPHVVIIGGGFGGLAAAKSLAKAPVAVTLVDQRNHHVFQPLLYQVATAALSPAEIASPIRGIVRKQANTVVVMAQVTDISTATHTISFSDGASLRYDYLIVATGAVDQYFGNEGWEKLAPGLKSLDDATEIRKRFLLAFEAAEREPDPRVRRSLLTTVVIGAGPTGVEMAGAMSEMARHSLTRDFRNIDPATSRIILVEGSDHVLAAYAGELSHWAEEALQKRGVEVRKKSRVSSITPEAVFIGDERIETSNVVWAAGIAASPLGAKLGVPVDRMGRVIVEPDLSIPGHSEVFVIGDLASYTDESGRLLPGLAPVATQQGRLAGINILRQMRGEATLRFAYNDRGTMATIGRGAAIAEIGKMKLRGFIAWLAWLFIHVMALIGFRNRVAVMLEWAWAYVSWQRGARLITGELGHGRHVPSEKTAAEIPESAPAPVQEKEKGWMSGDPAQAG